MVLDVGTEYDPPRPAINHESAPVPLFAQGHNTSFVDSEAHRTILPVEEAGIDSNDNGIGRNDLLYGAPCRGVSSGNQTELCHIEIDLEGVA